MSDVWKKRFDVMALACGNITGACPPQDCPVDRLIATPPECLACWLAWATAQVPDDAPVAEVSAEKLLQYVREGALASIAAGGEVMVSLGYLERCLTSLQATRAAKPAPTGARGTGSGR